MEPVTIAEIGRRTNIPTSSLRYYREKFGAFIPTEGSGRQRIHSDDAVAIFQLIHELFKKGLKARQVEKVLDKRFGRVITTAMEAQQNNKAIVDAQSFRDLLSSVNLSLQSINETLQLQRQFMSEWKVERDAVQQRLATETQSEQSNLKETLSRMREVIREKEKQLNQKQRLIWLVVGICLLSALFIIFLILISSRTLIFR